MLKAVREAKVRTSWINPNEEYESAVTGFVRALLGRLDGNLFLDDFRAQVPTFAWFGLLNSVSLALVKLTSPGVPDLYQGNELVDLSLVDPDNRRPVDYALRRRLLGALKSLVAAPDSARYAGLHALFDPPYDGRAKLWTIWRALELRRRQPDLFAHGDYHPVALTGAKSGHALAYARRLDGGALVVIAGRLFASLGLAPGVLPAGAAAWGDTVADVAFLPAGTRLENALTGELLAVDNGSLPLARALARFPGAVLFSDAPARTPS